MKRCCSGNTAHNHMRAQNLRIVAVPRARLLSTVAAPLRPLACRGGGEREERSPPHPSRRAATSLPGRATGDTTPPCAPQSRIHHPRRCLRASPLARLCSKSFCERGLRQPRPSSLKEAPRPRRACRAAGQWHHVCWRHGRTCSALKVLKNRESARREGGRPALQ